MNKQNSKTVAVVTSTIGRPELVLAIEKRTKSNLSM